MSENTETKSNKDWKSKEVGALWARRGKSQNYFSGYVTIGELGFEKKVRIVGFKNNFKDDEKHPDFRLYESEESVSQNSDQAQGSASDSPAPAPTPGSDAVEGEDQELF
jgi:uncharacterized protein (DUF736 family)